MGSVIHQTAIHRVMAAVICAGQGIPAGVGAKAINAKSRGPENRAIRLKSMRCVYVPQRTKRIGAILRMRVKFQANRMEFRAKFCKIFIGMPISLEHYALLLKFKLGRLTRINWDFRSSL
jgi:hypothetical protein